MPGTEAKNAHLLTELLQRIRKHLDARETERGRVTEWPTSDRLAAGRERPSDGNGHVQPVATRFEGGGHAAQETLGQVSRSAHGDSAGAARRTRVNGDFGGECVRRLRVTLAAGETPGHLCWVVAESSYG